MTARDVPDTPSDAPATTDQLTADQARIRRALEPDGRILAGVFGLAWLVGYGTLWVGVSDNGPRWVTPTMGGVTLAASLVIAVAVFAVHTAVRTSGVRGPSATSGAMYSVAWPLAFLALFLVMSGAAREGVDDATFSLLWGTVSPLVVGTLLMAASAAWRDWIWFGAGAWVVLVAGVAALAGYPTFNLVMSLAGGGGLVGVAVLYHAVYDRGRVRA